ncbi:hypothetical protein SEA_BRUTONGASTER_158 [Gordonia phage BrutonGaster]|uniref:Uncharacterized protein n=1 Tax=Gordonia phage BrutonGaster TaxID=2530116 RepID=A0A482JKU2_9CAUD|nr:hypothetical protein HOV26_gp024 [Gordonia phage BrutonGaster]QBP33372.1 hypothetical protein SEA_BRUTONGASTER_158 [Gordonia phage BrutonGaster]
MGYSFDYSGKLCCDNCGQSGGVRRRKCKYKVTLRNGGQLHYCPPPAYCAACYKLRGGLNGVHDDRCREGAEQSQAREDRRNALLDEGKHLVGAAWGSWDDRVPDGMVGVVFQNGASERWVLVDADAYRQRDDFTTLEDNFPDAVEWKNHA